MSPATSLAKPLARPITQCPYCGHVSPAESKFCNECGAALHLMPCPHCGAVNDITVATACYRCHGELRENAAVALPPPVADPAAAVPDEPRAAQPQSSPYVIPGAPARRRSQAWVVAVLLIAFAGAGYYALRQRDTQETARVKVPADSNTNAGAGNIIKAPATTVPNPAPAIAAVPGAIKTAKPELEPPREAAASAPVATAATRSSAGKASAARETVESPSRASVVPDVAHARADAAKGLDQKIPNIATCTDAVAALGLCKTEPTTRRQ